MTEELKPTSADDPRFRKIVAKAAEAPGEKDSIFREVVRQIEEIEEREMSPLLREIARTAFDIVFGQLSYADRQKFVPKPGSMDRYENAMDMAEGGENQENALRAIRWNQTDLFDVLVTDLPKALEDNKRIAVRRLLDVALIEEAMRRAPADPGPDLRVGDVFPVADANAFWRATSNEIARRLKRGWRMPPPRKHEEPPQLTGT